MSSRDLVVAAAGNTGTAKDDNFKNVSLLLQGDGTNGSQNNTLIAANGAAQGPFADPAGYWSNSFDGNGDYLSTPSSSAFLMGTGDYTLEAWIYVTAAPTQNYTMIVGVHSYGVAATWMLNIDTNLSLRIYNGDVSSTGGTISLNTWTHVAQVRNGSTLTGYINGTSVVTASTSYNNTSNPYNITIGADQAGTGGVFKGYMSNVRVVKGTAVYTSNFTVPTSPLTAISGTSLLTCQSNVICDTSSNLFAITANGNAAVNSKSPFTISSTYNPYSFSGYFDGSGDYLTVASNAAFDFGTGNFTIEWWSYQLASANVNMMLMGSSPYFAINMATTGFELYLNSASANTISASVPLNTWNHVAVVRNGSTVTVYVNGSSVGTVTNSNTLGYSNQTLNISGPFTALTGYISNIRIVKGTAVYTSNFTPSNEPLTAISGTSLLTCQSSTFVDNSPNNFTITVNGNTTVATASNSGLPITRNGNTTQGTFSPYGNLWSNYFDGSGDYLTAASNAAFGYGSGDFTIETWYYPTFFGTTNIIIDQRTSGATEVVPTLYTDSASGTLYYYVNGANRITGSNLALNTWQHIAISRSGTSTKLFVNGTQVGSTYSDSNNYATSLVSIGAYAPGASLFVNGYLSNLRIVKGTALYTSNFTPSTTPLTAVSGTSLLTCQSNRFKDNSSNNFTLTVAGNTSVQRFSPFNPTAPYSASTIGGSGYFDGSGDYLTIPADTAFNIGTNSFTTEFWHYKTSAAALQILFGINIQTSSGYAAVRLISNTDNTFTLNISSTGSSWVVNTTSTATISLNSWNHVAIVRNGSAINLYLNGVSIISATSSASLYVGNINVIGANVDGSGYGAFTFGYISNFRFVNGTAVYTTAFTPPTSPLTAITNTSLLCNFTNAGIPDAAMMNDLETVGNVQVSTSVKKYGTGSLAFDGSGDYLLSNSAITDLYAFGSGDFTVEFWAYGSSFGPGLRCLYDSRPVSTQGIYPTLYVTSGGVLYYYTNSANRITGPTLSTGTWYHIALCRSGTSTKLFVNGTQQGSTYTDSNNYLNTASRPLIGQFGDSTSPTGTDAAQAWNGYIDDLRITKGYARYTANFTPPAQALPTN